QGNRVIVGAEIAHNADRPHVGQGSEILAQALVHAGLGDLFPVDGIGILHDAHFLGGYFADDTDSQTGAGEWLTDYQVFRNTQFQAHLADLILKEEAQRLYDLLEINVIGETAYVVVGLDHSGFAQTGFDHIRIDGSLYQEIHSADLLCFFLENADELFADDLALLLRLFHAGQLLIEALLRVYTDEVQLIRTFGDRKSTRLNSSHVSISYAVFCLKKKTIR